MFLHSLNRFIQKKATSVLGVAFLALVILNSCKFEEDKIGAKYEGPLVEIKNASGRFSDSAMLKFTYKTPLQHKLQNEDEIYPNGIILDSYKNGKLETHLESDYAYHYKEDGRWEIKKNVKLKNYEENQTLETEELFWNPNSHQVWSDVDVKIITPDQQLNGVGLKAKDDFSKYEILKPTSVFFIESDDE